MATTFTNDAQLVAGHLAGDAGAFADIYDRYVDQVHDTAAAMLNSRPDAADITQDTFLIAAQKMEQLRDPARLRAWLFAIMRNEVYRRTQDKSREVPTDFFSDGGYGMADIRALGRGVDEVEREELAVLVRGAARGLDDRDQLVLELMVRQELEGADLADALGVSPNQSYTMVHRVRQRVERSLGAFCVARAGRRDCRELDAMLETWDGEFNVLIRKRVARHVDSCDTCTDSRKKLAPLALYSAAPILAAPPTLREQVLGALAFQNSPEGAAATQAGGMGAMAVAPAYAFSATGFPEPLKVTASPAAGITANAGSWMLPAAAAMLVFVTATVAFFATRGGDDADSVRIAGPATTVVDTELSQAADEADGSSTSAAGDDDSTTDSADDGDDGSNADGDTTLASAGDGGVTVATDPDDDADRDDGADGDDNNTITINTLPGDRDGGADGDDGDGTDTTTEPGTTAPRTTQPPATQPPATQPTNTVPATDPPATDPPVTDPPATDPPVTDPPATDPPVTTAAPKPGELSVGSSALAFGTSTGAASGSKTVTVRNVGEQSLSWTASGVASPFSISNSSGTIRAGGTASITVSFVTNAPGSYSDTLVIAGGGKSASVALSGAVEAVDNKPIFTVLTVRARCLNNGDARLIELTVAAAARDDNGSPNVSVNGVSGSGRVETTIQLTGKPGANSGQVVATATDSAGQSVQQTQGWSAQCDPLPEPEPEPEPEPDPGEGDDGTTDTTTGADDANAAPDESAG